MQFGIIRNTGTCSFKAIYQLKRVAFLPGHLIEDEREDETEFTSILGPANLNQNPDSKNI